MDLNEKIYVAGHLGMVGSSILRKLQNDGYQNLLVRDRKELDLTDQASVKKFFKTEQPDKVYLCAAKVGGIHANNTYPADFIYINLMIQANVINSAFQSGVKQLLFLGSSCIYPKVFEQPLKEDALLQGKLELTNEPYAIAKIAGIKMCESYNRQFNDSGEVDYRSVMPTNLYGPGDNYHLENSHVIPALIRKFHEAKVCNLSEVNVWGSGKPMREFLHVDDMADASIYIMNLCESDYKRNTSSMLSHINVGYGEDISIDDLAHKIANVVKYKGRIAFDASMPDGAPRKLLSSKLINSLGWSPAIDLDNGLLNTYNDFLLRYDS
tara:strand:+ start:1639 stop:2610 length:972 start_codon:yes stop_codon:yes gene_type:complete